MKRGKAGRSTRPRKPRRGEPKPAVTTSVTGPRNGQPLLELPRSPLTPEQRHVALVVYRDQRTRKQITQAICRRIVNGERVHKACSLEGVDWHTFWEWKLEDHELATLYARAREGSADSWEDKATEHTENATAETVQLARIREDNARWRAKMADRRRYVDRIDITAVSAQVSLEELVAGSMALKPGGKD